MHYNTVPRIMERCNVRLFYGCMFLALFLCLLEVSDTGPTGTPNENVCEASKFLQETNIMKTPCKPSNSEDYKNLTLKSSNLDDFLCLVIEDTSHKICSHYSVWTNLNSATFHSYIQKLNSSDANSYCQHLKGLIPLYEKSHLALKNFVATLNDLGKCTKVCFDFDNSKQLVCNMLAWVKSINENATHVVDITQTSHVSIVEDLSHVKATTTNIETTLEVDKEVENKQSITDAKVGKPSLETNKLKNDANQLSHIDSTEKNNPPKNKEPSKDTSKSEINSGNSEIKDNKNVIDPAQTSVKIESIDTNMEVKDKVGNSLDRPVLNTVQTSNSKTEEGGTQISENTQDQGTGIEDPNRGEPIYDNMDEETTTGAANENQEVPQWSANEPDLPRLPSIQAEEESHFFTYFTLISVVFIGGCIVYHNKQKILAIVLEGRRSKNNRGRRRPSTASYRKLDCTLEEAVTSQCNANVTHVIY